jgi:hypothetical protein
LPFTTDPGVFAGAFSVDFTIFSRDASSPSSPSSASAFGAIAIASFAYFGFGFGVRRVLDCVTVGAGDSSTTASGAFFAVRPMIQSHETRKFTPNFEKICFGMFILNFIWS